jgi:hypothetical protein
MKKYIVMVCFLIQIVVCAQDSIVVISPNGGEKWITGSTQIIQWVDNVSENVKIELYQDGNLHSLITSFTPNDSLYSWLVPPHIWTNSNYKIGIESTSDQDNFDLSDNNFAISGMDVTLPDGGEIWQAGEIYTITWDDYLVVPVRIEQYKNDTIYSILSLNTPSDGGFEWEIPYLEAGGNDFKMRMASTTHTNQFDFSDSSFTIVANELTVISPESGDIWNVGTTHQILWNANFDDNVWINLFKSEEFEKLISASTENDGSFDWTVPFAVVSGSDYQIKIGSLINSVISDMSDVFTITTNTGIGQGFSGISESYQLLQNYPNPLNNSTTLYYGLPEESSMEIIIYDVLGNEVKVYTEVKQAAGFHKIQFDANEYNSGVYFYRIIAGSFIETKKMVLMK